MNYYCDNSPSSTLAPVLVEIKGIPRPKTRVSKVEASKEIVGSMDMSPRTGLNTGASTNPEAILIGQKVAIDHQAQVH